MSFIRKHKRVTPRAWFDLFFRLGGWVSLVAVAIVLVLFDLTFANEYAAARFAREGQTVEAIVANHRTVRSVNSNGETRYTYYVQFDFETHRGEAVSVERSVGRMFHDDAKQRDAREIRYLSSEPNLIEYYVGEKEDRAQGGIFFGGIVGLIGLVALAVAGGRANRALLARRDGEKQIACVSEVKTLRRRAKKRIQGRLHWIGPDGFHGQSLTCDRDDLALYSAGSKIIVYRRGDDVWWEGDVGPRKADM